MNKKIIECKVKVADTNTALNILLQLDPIFKGEDHQIDTYYNATQGRLKLREGNIENALIQYSRENLAGTKLSQVVLYKHEPSAALKEILATQLGILVVIDKLRKIYFVDNVKFHFDEVQGLGSFVEIEAIDEDGTLDIPYLQKQCDNYIALLGLDRAAMQTHSYSDMLLQQ